MYIPVAAAAYYHAVLIFPKSHTNLLATENYDSERHLYLALEWNMNDLRAQHTNDILYVCSAYTSGM